MLESEIGESKIRIFSGNILRVSCDILFLYEAKQHSHAYKRLITNPKLKQKTSDRLDASTLTIYEASNLSFSKLIILDTTKSADTNTYKVLNEWSNNIYPLIPSPCKIAFNLYEAQEVEPFKNFIDRLINKKKIEAILVGYPQNTKYMLGHLSQSGHLLSVTSTSHNEALRIFFEKLACTKCKKIDPNCKINSENNIYCSLCALSMNINGLNRYTTKLVSKIREICYCKTEFLLEDKSKHLAQCIIAMFKCNYCEFEGGQSDIFEHLFNAHSALLLENIDIIAGTKNSSVFQKQCSECAIFYETSRNCVRCAKKAQKNFNKAIVY